MTIHTKHAHKTPSRIGLCHRNPPRHRRHIIVTTVIYLGMPISISIPRANPHAFHTLLSELRLCTFGIPCVDHPPAMEGEA